MVCAMLEAQRSGKGQVVDASMVEGSAVLMHMTYAFKAMGLWKEERGTNILDGGAHFYDSYETKDGKYIALGAIEPQFYALLIEKAELDAEIFGHQMNPSEWQTMSEELSKVFKHKTRDQWCELLEGTDVCFAPVLSLSEVKEHSHNKARGSFIEINNVLQPAPAPRFSKSVVETPRPPQPAGSDAQHVLKDFGFTEEKITYLKEQGVLT